MIFATGRSDNQWDLSDRYKNNYDFHQARRSNSQKTLMLYNPFHCWGSCLAVIIFAGSMIALNIPPGNLGVNHFEL